MVCSSFRYILYTLHSQMQSTDQRTVFKNPGPGVRKIVSIRDFSLNLVDFIDIFPDVSATVPAEINSID